MQALMDINSAQGWNLFSVTPDTWRKSVPTGNDSSQSPFEGLNPGAPAIEYTASYYLVVFQREDSLDSREMAATASEERPRSRKSPFQRSE